MIEIVSTTAQALWQVILVGILLGAGLPALFALGLRQWNVGRVSLPDGTVSGTAPTVNRVIAIALFALVIAAVLFGIVVIIFGKQLFAH